MIRISDPAKLGPALAQVRNLLGLSRHDLGRAVEAATGRPMIGVVHQVQQWDTGRHAPTVSSLGPVLDALGYDLALIPRNAQPDRCQSCDHLTTAHSEGGCWHTVTSGTPDKDLVCPCTAEPANPGPVCAGPWACAGVNVCDRTDCARNTPRGPLSATLSAETAPAEVPTYTWTGCNLAGHHGCTPRQCRWADNYPLQETYPGSGIYE